MGMFDLKGGSSNNWNYSDNTKQNYSEVIGGTVVEIDNPQSINYATKKPETWPDGNPKRNLRLYILQSNNVEVCWTFAPRSAAAQACLAALDPQDNRDSVSIEELLGKLIMVQTQPGVYNQAHPRPWTVLIQGEGNIGAVRGLNDLSKQAVQQAQAPAPMAQSYAPQAMAPQTQAQQVVNTAMNQAMMAAQQAAGFQGAAPVAQPQVASDPTGGYYDQDIPF